MVGRAKKQEETICAEPNDNYGGRGDRKNGTQQNALPMEISDHSPHFLVAAIKSLRRLKWSGRIPAGNEKRETTMLKTATNSKISVVAKPIVCVLSVTKASLGFSR